MGCSGKSGKTLTLAEGDYLRHYSNMLNKSNNLKLVVQGPVFWGINSKIGNIMNDNYGFSGEYA